MLLCIFITSFTVWRSALVVGKIALEQTKLSQQSSETIIGNLNNHQKIKGLLNPDIAKKFFYLSSKKKQTFLICILVNLVLLGVFKYYNFFAHSVNDLATLLHLTNYSLPLLKLILPLGISYYTFASLGYLIDVYKAKCRPQNNLFKLSLFSMFFPTLTVGPIHSYNNLATQLYEAHCFDYQQFTFGVQRIIWGLLKKLVIADRLALFVNPIFNDYTNYPAIYLVIATIFFAFQFYCDFSGCVDIAIGVGQMFGIKMNENFKQPFFSRTFAEFFRRWHITLFDWFKSYVFFPFFASKFLMFASAKFAKLFGTKAAKNFETYFSMLVVWFLIGLWHGDGWKYVILVGFVPCFIIILSDMFKTIFQKTTQFLKINTESIIWKSFQTLRTFTLFCIGCIFFRANDMKSSFEIFSKIASFCCPYILLAILLIFTVVNIRIIALKLLTKFDRTILFLFSCLAIAVMIFQILKLQFLSFSVTAVMPKHDFMLSVTSIIFFSIFESISQFVSFREIIAKQILLIRWVVYIALILFVIMFGVYGSLVEQNFIYQVF
jgi:D-alanyl-lipoteichoic acid acyltransferase DltB (MBOAT superfamily)